MTEHAFQAQVSEVLSLVINSLYSNPEIFLRELLSNASDALDKERFLAITAPDSSSEALRIRLVPDEAGATLTIDDNGLGMDETELKQHLGTIAHSGSREFLKQLQDKKDVNLIGQFGVGFYSAYLVADRVEVISRKRGSSEAFKWTSDGKQSFTIEKAERGERGTSVTLHLKDEHKGFLQAFKLRELVSRYSDYVSYPIELVTKDKEGETKLDRINQASALWKRKPSEISDEQYDEFYKHLTHDWEAPYARRHFHVEGTQEFTGILFIPKRPPFDMFSPDETHGVRLHVKRVFIMDDAKELVPRFLRFLRGVIDSEDLPLNVSRELLQDSKVVRIIRKQVVKQALDMLDEIAEKKPDDYRSLWKTYGAVLKEGLHFETENKERIAKLIRFESSKADGLTSLADYRSRMPEAQSAIYYLLGPTRRTVESSPHLETLKARGYEVLYLTDPVDQWAIAGLGEFDGKPLRSAMDEKLDLGSKTDGEEKKAQTNDAPLDALISRFTSVLDGQVSEVRTSERLTDSPTCLVVPDGGLGPYVERILRMQQGYDLPVQKRIMEINAEHPLIRAMRDLHQKDENSEEVRDYVELLYDQALLSEGSPVEDPARIAKHLTRLMQRAAEGSRARAE
jgi:molecular chaperone HtpG